MHKKPMGTMNTVSRAEPVQQSAASNLPEKKFKAGAISATVWKNRANSPEGVQEYRTVSFQRTYKDKQDDSWKTTNSLRIQDLPKATVVLQKAYEYLVMKDGEPYAEA